jgi:hypothetical protein
MTAIELLRKAYAVGPVLFGIGFVAPVLAQTMDALSVDAPLGMGRLRFALVVGILSGTVAKLRGRWI